MGEQIVLGLGDNIDYEIRWDSALLEGLIRDSGLSASEINRNAKHDYQGRELPYL
jgi:ADP-dependent phosphofructokinase/glucokinase